MDISDDDISAAMREIPGYLDITPGDFKEIYLLAFRHARERLSRSLQAKDVMTREVAWVSPDTPLAEVAELMSRRGISGVPVVADGRVAGMISEKDFLFHMGAKEIKNFMELAAQCLRDQGCQGMSLPGGKAADLMTSPAVTVGEDVSVLEIARIFKEENINRAPVIDSQGRLTGIVARADLLDMSG
jgi:CBS domain-containing protein